MPQQHRAGCDMSTSKCCLSCAPRVFQPSSACTGDGVLLGAGVCVLGAHYVGAGSKVGAGSVVVTDLPAHCVAVGVPARIIKQGCMEQPSENMDCVEDFILDYVI